LIVNTGILKGFYTILFLLFSFGCIGYSQGEIDDGSSILFRNENTYAFNIYSSGWGVDYRAGKWINAFKKRIISGGIIIYKDHKEYKENPRAPYFPKFVFGKENNFFSLRTGYGYQHEVYSKFDKSGIAIKYYYQGGPSIGLLKPIYYNRIITYNSSTYRYDTESQKFNKDNIHSPLDILSRDSFFKGINETKLRMGLFVEVGASFEFGQDDSKVNALQTGLILEVFHKTVPIMAIEKPNWFFLSLFASYRFGKIKDARYN